MQELHGVGKLPQAQPRDERAGKQLRGELRIRGERARDQLPQRLLPETRRRRIDGREAIGQRRAGFDHLELRMHDLAAEVAVAHIAEHADTPARRERLLLARIEVEEAQNELRARAAFAVFEQTHELSPRPVLDLGVDDRALGLLQDAARERGERDDPRVILVAQRQMQHQVLVADEPETRKLLGEPARGGPGGGRRLRRGRRRRRYQIGNGALAARDVIPRVRERLRLRASRPWAKPPPDRSRAPDTAA